MRSATSYFNSTLYRKTMARFWPLWGLWGLMWMFLIPLRLLSTYFNDSRWQSADPQADLLLEACDLPTLTGFGLAATLFFAVLCAMAVFGYLYSHRSACWAHALPLRREALFTTQYLAGLSFLLLPQLAAAALTAIVEMSFLPAGEWGRVLGALGIWLLAQSGACLFFFSFAAFCAMFTGHILALPAFYFIFNILASVVWSLLDILLNEFFYGYYGIPGVLDIVRYLTPMEALGEAVHWNFSETGGQFSSPGTVAVYALVSVPLFFLSLHIYRRRHVETAGDVVAVPLVRPLFKYGVSFCSGLAFGLFTAAFFNFLDLPVLITSILVWTVIGYFAAEMLLKKSFQVLRAWKGAAATAAALLAVCVFCRLDPFGVVARVPASGQVESVHVEIDMGCPYDSGRHLSADLTGPAQIEKIAALHQAIVDHRDQEVPAGGGQDRPSDYTSAYLTYHLSNGSQLRRRYTDVYIDSADLEIPGTTAYAFQQIAGDRELVAMVYDFDSFLKDARLTSAYLSGLYTRAGDYAETVYLDDFRQQLWDAVQQDFAEGTIGVRYLFDYSEERRSNTYRADLFFETASNYSETYGPANASNGYSETVFSSRTLSITLTPQARHVLAVLEEAGIFQAGYSLLPPTAQEGDAPYPATSSR